MSGSNAKVRFLFALFALSMAGTVHAYVNPPVLVPATPEVGEAVAVQVVAGDCDRFIEFEGYPILVQNGNEIHLTAFSYNNADQFPDPCGFPDATTSYPLGSFPQGSYTVRFDRVYPTLGGLVTETLAVLPLVVGGGNPLAVPLPVFSFGSMLALIVILAVIGGFLLKRPGGRTLPFFFIVGALNLMHAPDTVAQDDAIYIEVLLSTEASSPTPEDVFQYFEEPGSEPPISSLMIGSPSAARYLLPFRASGDFLEWIQENPDLPRARLERYVLITYPGSSQAEEILSALRADPHVVSANEALRFLSPLQESTQSEHANSDSVPDHIDSINQYGRAQLNIDQAWDIAGGHALVGIVDSGVFTNHPSLRAFDSTGQYVGGNFIQASSKDVSLPDVTSDYNVDEAEPANYPPNSDCYNGGQPLYPVNAGHGTHVAGLISANSSIPGGVKGTCKKCGVAVAKTTWVDCDSNGVGALSTYPNSHIPAITFLIDAGVQVINLSFGNLVTPVDLCAAPPLGPFVAFCDALGYAQNAQVAVVAASGNARGRIFFPASDPRSIAVGGIDSNENLWDQSPGSHTNCPHPILERDCGSNYTTNDPPDQKRQELVAAAKDVWSTAYPNKNWPIGPNGLPCGDGHPGPGWGNGQGLCTGTSMSAPQVTGIAGLIRSINPLVKISVPLPDPLLGQKYGIRSTLALTTAQSQATWPPVWSPTIGYGVPDAAEAARRMLGVSAGVPLKNRATPLFRLYSSTNLDYAYTTSPQFALALMRGKVDNGENPAPPQVAYSPSGTIVPNYLFPYDPVGNPWPSTPPRANAYVLTTEYMPSDSWVDLVPLYLMDRTYSGGRDFMLVTTPDHIEQAHATGYKLRTIQGYILSSCTRTVGCKGAEPFYRACKSADHDCAHFLESERAAFESAGYTNVWPANAKSKIIGYAFPVVDSDSDGLIDGFERVIGTDPYSPNSDSSGGPDGDDYPLAELPKRDPCTGSAHTCSGP